MQGRQNDDPAAIKTNKKSQLFTLICIEIKCFLARGAIFFMFQKHYS